MEPCLRIPVSHVPRHSYEIAPGEHNSREGRLLLGVYFDEG